MKNLPGATDVLKLIKNKKKMSRLRNCSDIAGMLLKSTGEFLEVGLQKSGNEFWESADDSTASDEIR